MKTIGVLDLQGDVREHIICLEKIKVNTKRVKVARDLETVEGLVIPGGESTTLSILLAREGLDREIKIKGENGFPIFGTCAGMILLARKIVNPSGREKHLQLIDIVVKRNAFGRQVDSFETELSIDSETRPFPGVFIRAPRIEEIGPKVDTLSKYRGEPVMVKEKNILCCSFHPELTDDLRVHQYFLSMVDSYV